MQAGSRFDLTEGRGKERSGEERRGEERRGEERRWGTVGIHLAKRGDDGGTRMHKTISATASDRRGRVPGRHDCGGGSGRVCDE